MAEKFSGENPFKFSVLAAFIFVLALIAACIPAAQAVEAGAPIPPEQFGDDYYKVYGRPNITLALEQDRVYQGEDASLFLTLTNLGRITSFQVNEEPAANKREEILAAQKEQELEKLRTVAQDVSVLLSAENDSAIDIKRRVAYPGSIREGQTSARLEFPIDVYKNTPPGSYRLIAVVNFTYQRDVAVKGDEDHPESPDVFYWYDSISQTIPLILTVERRSGAEFAVTSVSPQALAAGTEDNVVKIRIKNVGYDTAKDLVARLRPESGIYVSVDESPIKSLPPGQEAELVYKMDVSKDAVPGKNYQLRVVFEFSDSKRDDLADWENAYIMVEPVSAGRSWAALFIIIIALAGALLVVAKKKGKI
ncbi:MAG: hypothetical protein A4E49_01935 [Methanosaeta sp. PtaU1.Bin112]|nr:MAG: hypothetical protein A4E49_01935 [Methanosaeta sp. PtaU1.Bin112]